MPDREKVLNGLKKCMTPSLEDCVGCPYFNGLNVNGECNSALLVDALELLKGQEPRVLTFDELMALPHGKEDNVPVVSEVKYPVGVWNKGTLCKWRGAEFLQEMVQDHKWYNREHYGKIWRVWTALPSIEQRKAVKWDE